MKKIILIYSILTVSALIAFSQSDLNFSGNGAPIELQNADSLIGTTEQNKGIYRYYEGNVAFKQGDLYVKCQKAVQNISANTIDLTGNVVITQNDLKLTSPKVFYNGSTRIAQSTRSIIITDKNMKLVADQGYYNTNTAIANFYGNVSVIDDTVKIKSDSIEYNRRTLFSKAYGNAKVEDDSSIIYGDYLEHHRQTRDSKAIGNVIIIGKYNSTYLTTDTIEYNAQMRYTYATENPILFKIDTTINTIDTTIVEIENDSSKIAKSNLHVFDTMSISSNKMESIRINNDDRYIFSGNTQVYKNNLQALADTIIYYNEDGLIYLYGSPVVWYDSTQLIADTISIYIKKNNKVDKIIAQGAAFATIKNDTINSEKINQLMGHTISILFKNDTIDFVNSFGDAKSLLFMSNDDGTDDGATQTSADTIKVKFIDGEASQFIGLGGIVGEAIPENILIVDIKKYYLPDFRRKDNKPQKKSLLQIN